MDVAVLLGPLSVKLLISGVVSGLCTRYKGQKRSAVWIIELVPWIVSVNVASCVQRASRTRRTSTRSTGLTPQCS